MKRSLAGLAALSAFLVTFVAPMEAPAEAAEGSVTFRVKGTVNDLSNVSGVQLGDPYVLDYTFDPQAAPHPESQSYNPVYPVQSMTFTIGDYKVTKTGGVSSSGCWEGSPCPGSISLRDNYYDGYPDKPSNDLYRTDFIHGLTETGSISPAPLYNIAMELWDYAAGADADGVVGLQLPVEPPDPAKFDGGGFMALSFRDNSCFEPFCPQGHLVASVDSITVVPVAPQDEQPPAATISAPADGSTHALLSKVPSDFTCTDNVALAVENSCVGTVPVGSNIDTSVVGTHPFSVTATDAAGLTATTTSSYTVSTTLAAGLALWGSFTSIPAGYNVSAQDAGASGVTIGVSGVGTEDVVMSVCDGFTVRIAPGSVVTLTCGSVIADVATGSARVELPTTSGVVTMTVPAGGSATLKDTGDVLVAADSSVPVTVAMAGVVQQVAPGASLTSRAQGFYQPIKMDGVWNTVRAGSTVPVKFELFYGTTEITDSAAVRSLTVAQVSCDSTGSGNAVDRAATANAAGIRYDPASGHFIANWSVPKQENTCQRLTMTTTSATTLSALFKVV